VVVVSWIERAVEEQLAQAARNGDLDAPHLHGKPLADLDRQRPQGWWADAFVERELSHDRRARAEAAAATARVGFWQAATVTDLHAAVAAANAAIVRANVNLVPADRLAPFDPADIEARWHRLR